MIFNYNKGKMCNCNLASLKQASTNKKRTWESQEVPVESYYKIDNETPYKRSKTVDGTHHSYIDQLLSEGVVFVNQDKKNFNLST